MTNPDVTAPVTRDTTRTHDGVTTPKEEEEVRQRKYTSSHHIHPTTSTSTPEPTTVDGRIQGRCPACGSCSLFVGAANYITCSWIDCPDPAAPSRALGAMSNDRSSRPVTSVVARTEVSVVDAEIVEEPWDEWLLAALQPRLDEADAAWVVDVVRASVIAQRPRLAERQARYLEVRQHTLSIDSRPFASAIEDQADYVLGEAAELVATVQDLTFHGQTTDAAGRVIPNAELRAEAEHELADVVLAAVTLANLLGVSIEACIEAKTELDRGRG